MKRVRAGLAVAIGLSLACASPARAADKLAEWTTKAAAAGDAQARSVLDNLEAFMRRTQ